MQGNAQPKKKMKHKYEFVTIFTLKDFSSAAADGK